MLRSGDAGGVPEVVVDVLEPVEVDVEDGVASLARRPARLPSSSMNQAREAVFVRLSTRAASRARTCARC